MKDQKKFRCRFPLIRSGPFITLWTGQSLAMITSEIVQFSLIWWLTDSYRSATVVSWATLSALLPRAVLNPVIGVLVDRWNRRSILVISHIAIILAMAFLGYIFQTDNDPVVTIFIIIFICAISKSFQSPAMLSSTSLMVPAEHIPRVAGLNQLIQGIMRIVSPSLGAILLLKFPMSGIVMVDIAGASLGLISLLFVMIPKPEKTSGQKSCFSGRNLVFQDIMEGIRYIRNWPGAVEMLGISTTVNFLSCPAFMLVSLLITGHFGGDEKMFGTISAAIGMGMICGGILLSLWSGFRRPMITSLMGVIGMACALLITGIIPSYADEVATISMFTGGFMIPVSMAPIQALVQKSVEPELQGRVLSLMDWISSIISPVSLAIAGPVYDELGSQIWYIGSGVLALLIGSAAFFSQKIRDFGDPRYLASESKTPDRCKRTTA